MNEIEVKKYELPKLEIKNYDEILEEAKKDTEKYQKYIVTKATLDEDTKKRAELNKTAKAINDRRLAIEKEISQPIKEFKSKCDAIKNLYEESSSLLDKQIKVFEEQEKQSRKEKIEVIFNENVKELANVLSFDSVFNEKWLNKGSWKDGKFALENELIEKIDVIRKDLITIESLNSEYEIELKNDYLTHFELGEVIRKNNKLQEQKQLLNKQKEETKVIIEEQKQEKIEEMIDNPVEVEEIDPIKTYILKITGTLSQQKALKKFLETNNMKFERVE